MNPGLYPWRRTLCTFSLSHGRAWLIKNTSLKKTKKQKQSIMNKQSWLDLDSKSEQADEKSRNSDSTDWECCLNSSWVGNPQRDRLEDEQQTTGTVATQKSKKYPSEALKWQGRGRFNGSQVAVKWFESLQKEWKTTGRCWRGGEREREREREQTLVCFLEVPLSAGGQNNLNKRES